MNKQVQVFLSETLNHSETKHHFCCMLNGDGWFAFKNSQIVFLKHFLYQKI